MSQPIEPERAKPTLGSDLRALAGWLLVVSLRAVGVADCRRASSRKSLSPGCATAGCTSSRSTISRRWKRARWRTPSSASEFRIIAASR